MFAEESYDGKYLTNNEIMVIHKEIIDKSEVKDDDGFIDQTGALFDSAVSSIFGGFGGMDLYPSVVGKATRLCFNIISNHCFLNANKRTGLMAMLATFEVNGIEIEYDEDTMFDMICGIGSNKYEYEEFLEYIESCIVKVDAKKVTA